MFFDDYEKITYNLGGRTLTLSDIFRSVSFVNVENNNAFYDYYIQEGETPEMVSQKLYGNTLYSWLILLINNIKDIKNEWFVSTSIFNSQRERIYGGNAYYISTLPELKSGDIMIKVTQVDGNKATGITTGTYQHIAEFDKTLRKIRGICGSAGFTNGDKILFLRKEDNDNISILKFKDNQEESELINYTEILKTEQYIESVEYFYLQNQKSKIILNPYKIGITGSSIPTNTLYSNPGDTLTNNNFAFTILYKYGACGGYENISKKTVGEEFYNKYIQRQKIKVLRLEYVPSVYNTIRTALVSDTIGNRFTISI